MKRSQINSIMQSAEAFIRQCRFHLPPFADWTPKDWEEKRNEVGEIITNRLGWDITDFGSGNFQKCGLFLFTLRNGSPENWKRMQGKLYAEKIMVVDPDQVTPMHFHWRKMEDIINRGGGNLIIQLYNSTPDEKLDVDREIEITTDGVHRTLSPGGSITLTPGESITLPPYCYHKFWGENERVLVGEVSIVNDDHLDNRFVDPIGRFPVIMEDELPLHYLVTDYVRFKKGEITR
jgi:D-lyxose ketol-isomerase